MKYSVIVPAYQAENTISRCLDSLLAEMREDTEIIVINDGSTDRTEEICTWYDQQNENIRYFRQENGGVSKARNLGLDNARGSYVLFVDSDDFVMPGYLSVIDCNLTDDCDFLMFGKAVYDGKVTRMYPLCDRTTDTQSETTKFLCRLLTQQKLNALFTKVFCRKILLDNCIRFDERLSIGEDKLFVVRYITFAKKAVFVRQPLYTLSLENEESLSRKKRENLCDHILLEHQLMFETVEHTVHSNLLKKAVCFSYHRSAYTVIRELDKFLLSREHRIQEIDRICCWYRGKKYCLYYNLWHWLFYMPIRFRMTGVLDFVLQRKK